MKKSMLFLVILLLIGKEFYAMEGCIANINFTMKAVFKNLVNVGNVRSSVAFDEGGGVNGNKWIEARIFSAHGSEYRLKKFEKGQEHCFTREHFCFRCSMVFEFPTLSKKMKKFLNLEIEHYKNNNR